MSTCCLRSTLWEGTPTGTVTTLAGAPNPVYVANPAPTSTSRAAILLIHDLLGWTFPNARLLADAYAREADATVYLPDFFGGEVVPFEPVLAGRFDEIDLPAWTARNNREVREPEIVAFARALRASGEYDKIGAIGFCFGGWAVFRLGAHEFAQEGGGKGLVDCISAGHPTWLTEKDVEEVAVPAQLLAPELDITFTAEMKLFTFSALQKKGISFDYQHLPGVMHGCLTRGDATHKGEREAMVRGKDAAVAWFRQWLHE
ncbi:Alpha/Beta hydrolase protein [Parachaetomium inaequale]|uniref:Alpha/Beta hydrolase protein n=1 Tax=Parachaetomium inaequale TaxID=2588326 RepID=A0AAN6PBW0_9PEZI|nr:Alpha/Beta hydrolase protein [Parachaetomium inaequale]